MTKIYCFLLVLLFYFSSAYSAWNDSLYNGKDSQTNLEFTGISNVDEFNLFVEAANSSEAPLEVYIKLIADIDLGYFFDGERCRSKADSSIASFTPIASHNGLFDGNNFTIRGLCIQDNETNQNVGLFREKQGSIRNLIIDSAYIEGYNAGAFVGQGGEKNTLKNTHVSNSKIIGISSIGGLVGKKADSIVNVSVINTELILNSGDELGYIGGLIGQNSFMGKKEPLTISNAIVKSNLSTNTKSYLGGLIGYSNDLPLIISSSFFEGNITSTSTNDNESSIGGLIGYVSADFSIKESYRKGSISTSEGLSLGGLIGTGYSQATNHIFYCYQIGSIQAKATTYVGQFIGSVPNGAYQIVAVYSVLDSNTSLPPVHNNSNNQSSFMGFIASEGGNSTLLNNVTVKPSLLKNSSAAYLLNNLYEESLQKQPNRYELQSINKSAWTQLPDSNDGYPFFAPEYYYPIKQVILVIDPTTSDTLYNSPLTGKLDSTVLEKYSAFGGVGQNVFSFEEMNNGNYVGFALKPQTIIYDNKILYLTESNRYAINYDLDPNDFIYWLGDSISDYSDLYNTIDIPSIIKDSSCFLGWQIVDNPTPTLQNFIDLSSLSNSDITITPVWGNDLTNCGGLLSTAYNTIYIETANSLVSLSNNGKVLSLGPFNYSIPMITDANNQTISVPIRVDVYPKKGYELDSLYLYKYSDSKTKPFISGTEISVSEPMRVNASVISTTGAPNPIYSITYNIPFEPVNDTTPTLFTTNDIDTLYGLDKTIQHFSPLVKAHYDFNYWKIYCSEKGTCSQSGFLTDTIISDHLGYLPVQFEGNITLEPVFTPAQAQTFIEIELEETENGHLVLLNNNREILSKSGKIKFPIVNDIFPPFSFKPMADSCFELSSASINYIQSQYSQPIDINSTSDLPSYYESFSISTQFSKMILGFASHEFTQKGGALSYLGTLDEIKANEEVSVTISIQDKTGAVIDSIEYVPVQTNDLVSMKKLNLPLGDLSLIVSMKVANTVISKQYDFFVDTALQFLPSSWQMISLSNISPSYKKSRDESLFAWNDTTSLGDYWQYQELFSMDQINPSQGYWYQAVNGKSIPLKMDTTSIDPHTMISWDLVAGKTGWNMIANPYHWPINLNAPYDDDFIAFWKWNDSLGAYDRVNDIEANSAVWVHVTENMRWETYADPFTQTNSIIYKTSSNKVSSINPENWRLQIKLSNNLGKEDAYNIIGVGTMPSVLEEPPQGMGSFVNLSILNNNEKLAQNIISSKSSLWSWDILLSSSDNNDAELKIEGINTLTSMGYRVALALNNEVIELTDETPIAVHLKQAESKATITVMPAETFSIAKKIDQLNYHKQGSIWSVQFNAGLTFNKSKAIISLHNINGEKISQATTNVHIGSNEVFLNGADFAGVAIMNITIYNENGSILYKHNQKLLERR